MKTKTTVLRIPNDVHKALKQYAIKTGMKLEAMAANAVREYLAARKDKG